MIYDVENLNGTIITLNNPLSVKISMDEDAPADSITAQFVIDSDSEYYKAFVNDQLVKIKVYDVDKSRIILNGLIDEQIVSVNDKGIILTVVARSTASLLLDNEAKPQIYNSFNSELLYKRHLKPYGYIGFNNTEDRRYIGIFEVGKGVSEWQVIEKFCKEFMIRAPRIKPNNTVDFLNEYKDSGITFSNKDNTGLFYSSIEENYKRYKLISEVFVRSFKDGNYDNRIKDNVSINRGIIRKRYINAVGDNKSPIFRGTELIKNANYESFELKITYPGGIPIELFDKVTVDDEIIGTISNLIAVSISYTLDKTGEKCKITFRKE